MTKKVIRTPVLENLGIRVIIGSWIWKFISRRTGALAFYNTIHIRTSIAPRLTPENKNRFAELLAHEYCHVLQFRDYKYTFLFRYIFGILFSAIISMWQFARIKTPWWLTPFEFLNQVAKSSVHFRNAYLSHRFEVEAREYQKVNYTSWVNIIQTL
jgi:hypothetical protein